jgi:heptosyltransferase-2
VTDSPQSIGHLAVAAPRWVGDLVMATPVLEAALGAAHVARTTILVREALVALLHGSPVEPHLWPTGGRGGERAALRELRPDAVLLLSNSFGTAWRAWLARVPVRAGTSLRGRRAFLTHAVVPPLRDGRRAPVPTAHLQRDVAGLLGVQPADLHPRLYVGEDERAASVERLAALGLEPGAGYVVCTPGAAFGAAKLWPVERFAAALDELHERHGWRGVVSGGPQEGALIGAVADHARHDVLSLAGSPGDLASLKALIAGARLLLVGDSGPRWIAAAFDVPCVSIMGPNVPELTATSLEHCEIVRVEDLDCSPCARRTCPLGHHRCMRDIGVERVVAAAERALASHAVPA